MNINYYKIYHNHLLSSIIIWSFLEWYWKWASLKIIFIILPIIFSEELFNILLDTTKSWNYYSRLWDGLNIDLNKEIQLNYSLTKISIIYWIKYWYFDFKNNEFIFFKKWKYKSNQINNFIKSSHNLWIILWKLKDENEIFYHLYNY